MRKGLTLVEIAVVLIVLGILVSVAIPVISASTRRVKLMDTELQLQEIRVALLTHFISKGYLPPSGPGNTVPTESLGLPYNYKFDKLTGSPVYYYADNTLNDTVKIDDVPMGERSAIFISKGFDGTFNGQDTLHKLFRSVGGSEFDDILLFVSELDLKGLFTQTPMGPSKTCDEYKLVIKNKNVQGYTNYVRLLHPASTSTIVYPIQANGEGTYAARPATIVQICGDPQNFGQSRTTFFNVASYNEGDDCVVEIVIYSHLSTTPNAYRLPLITPDVFR
ncbi:MAG: type II secretion system protein [candidate division WOR-3 bacterium]